MVLCGNGSMCFLVVFHTFWGSNRCCLDSFPLLQQCISVSVGGKYFLARRPAEDDVVNLGLVELLLPLELCPSQLVLGGVKLRLTLGSGFGADPIGQVLF